MHSYGPRSYPHCRPKETKEAAEWSRNLPQRHRNDPGNCFVSFDWSCPTRLPAAGGNGLFGEGPVFEPGVCPPRISGQDQRQDLCRLAEDLLVRQFENSRSLPSGTGHCPAVIGALRWPSGAQKRQESSRLTVWTWPSRKTAFTAPSSRLDWRAMWNVPKLSQTS